jgi:hypothetical protein
MYFALFYSTKSLNDIAFIKLLMDDVTLNFLKSIIKCLGKTLLFQLKVRHKKFHYWFEGKPSSIILFYF